MTSETLLQFFGWCLVINVGIMFFSMVVLVLFRDWAARIHANMFDLEPAWVRQSYFTYLANYKIAVIVLNLVPWIALKLLGN